MAIDYERIRRIVREEVARHSLEMESIAAQRDFDVRMEKLLAGLKTENEKRAAGNFKFESTDHKNRETNETGAE